MKERLKNTKKRFVKKIIVRNKPLIIGLFLISIIGIIVVPSIFASLQPVKSIEILSSNPSYSSNEGGAWKVTNSAEFISNDTVKVTVDLDTISKGSSNYKDIVFLIDTSESMLDAKFSTLKSGVVASIENILKDTNNKVGIVSFNSSATLASSLSNSKSDLINKVNSLTKGTGTSYYQAFMQVENILKTYSPSSTRDFNVILITDGAPSKDRPNDVALYKYLKDAYPFINISGVQYEAGDKLLEEIKSVSDKQYLTKIDNLNEVLNSIVKSATSYKRFYISEYLNNDNFMVESINDIKVDSGSVSLNNNRITWNLTNIDSGSKAKMTFNAKLKNTSNGIYELNDEIDVDYYIGNVNYTIRSDSETPVLSNNYKVKYDGNAPSGCTISGVPTDTTHKVFETVGIATAPKCSGYQFKGWDIVTDNVTKINDDYFVMPEADVTLKANWSKINIRKSTDGEVEEGWTLYKQVKSDANSSNRYAKKYTGSTSTFTGNNDVYYYYGEAANNNVIFANYCWKIVRTTDTGGVKLLYNGVPSNGACNNTGDASALTAAQMGTSSNKVAFNTNYQSPADVGYMYNTRYNYGVLNMENQTADTTEKEQQYTTDTLSLYDLWAHHHLISKFSVQSDGKYYINHGYRISAYEDHTGYLILDGFYNDQSPFTDGIYDHMHYVVKDDGSNVVTITLSNGALPTSKMSKTIEKNGDTYNLVSPITVEKSDLLTSGEKYKDYYICANDLEQCSTNQIRRITRVGSNYNYFYTDQNNGYKYGNSYTYSNGKYLLKDTVENEPDANHHYTCFNVSGECSELRYVNYFSNNILKYIKLTEGKGVEDALNEMLYNNDVNKNDSTIKKAIDYWYKNNMTGYTSYLEDTVWCNDRIILETSHKGGWNPNGGSLSAPIYFKPYHNPSNLICTNKNDRFTVSSTNGNGALTYPVGLVTKQEQNLSYSSSKSPLTKGVNYWGTSPSVFNGFGADVFYVRTDGVWYGTSVSVTNVVAPAVSLRAGIEYRSGDGSSNHPYVIATN